MTVQDQCYVYGKELFSDMNGADAIVKCLELEGVSTVFGYPGVAITPFYDSILESDISTVLIRTEQNAAHAASGVARMTGRPGVCAVTSGPGATNLLTGIATAYADSIPLVCITGQVHSELLGSDAFQEADVTGAAESFVKYSYLIKNVEDIPRVMKEAFYVANSGRKGPVLIDVPIDIQNAELKNFRYPEDVSMRTYKPNLHGHAMQIRKMVNALTKAKKPLLYVGGGVATSGAVDELRAFSEKLRLPVVSTMMGIGMMATEHPMYYGMVGNNGKPYANRALMECDTLVMIGARVADRSVNQPDVIMHNKTVVHIDVDPAEIGKNAGSTIPLVGDAKMIFDDLLVQDIPCEHEEWIETLNNYRNTMIPTRCPNPAYTDPARLIRTLCDCMNDRAVYVADVGQNQIWSCSYANIRNGRFMTSGGMGTMGYSIPAALGAKVADPKRQVVAVCGDGSFQMSMMELATMKQYDIPVKVVVLRNNYLGMVREYQQNTYQGRYSVVDIAGAPKLDKLAEAYDIPYVRVSVNDEIDAAVAAFLENDECYLMEVIVDPMDTVK